MTRATLATPPGLASTLEVLDMGDTTPTDLYRFYDSAGRLLYVGISLHAAQRAAEHKRGKSWWPDVARMEVEHLGHRREAEEEEQRAIIAERPLHNIVYNGKRPPDADTNSPFEFDARFMSVAEHLALVEAIQAIATRLDSEDLGSTPGRETFISAVDGLARSAIYGDCCDKCYEIRYPAALTKTGPTWGVCIYQCPTCNIGWSCGWTLNMATIAAWS